MQLACVPGPLQKVPRPVQPVGAVLQAQDALPAAPVHVAFVVQVVEFVALTKRQLLASVAHVEMLLPPEQNGPFVVQFVVLQPQTPEAPQVWCGPQAVVVCVKQPAPSLAQWTDELPEQESPTTVQAWSTTQAQAPTPGLPVQAWFAGQPTAVSAKMQLFPSVLQVETVELVAQKVAPEPPTQSTGGASQVQAPVGLLPVQLS